MPALMQKSLWHVLSWQDVHDNLRSLFWGLGFHAYAVAWWAAPANRFLNANGLRGRFPEALINQQYKGRDRGRITPTDELPRGVTESTREEV